MSAIIPRAIAALRQSQRAIQVRLVLVLSRLDTPEKRIWFIVFVFGLTLVLIAVVIFEASSYWNHGLLDVLLGNYSRLYLLERFMFYVGLLIAVVGYLFAFHHDKTVGRLIIWIKTGQ